MDHTDHYRAHRLVWSVAGQYRALLFHRLHSHHFQQSRILVSISQNKLPVRVIFTGIFTGKPTRSIVSIVLLCVTNHARLCQSYLLTSIAQLASLTTNTNDSNHCEQCHAWRFNNSIDFEQTITSQVKQSYKCFH